jgi:hypothetical protein
VSRPSTRRLATATSTARYARGKTCATGASECHLQRQHPSTVRDVSQMLLGGN